MEINEEMKINFSVLMSVYKNENAEFFKQALTSIMIDQTLLPDEFVLVVDGPVSEELNSTIDEFEKRFNDKFKVVRLEENQGLGKALNYGLQFCSNEIIARADSDDICNHERFKQQIDAFKADPELDICGSYIDEFEDYYTEILNQKRVPVGNKDIYNMAKFRNPINHMTVMFKKEKILNIGSYKDLPYVEDYFLWVRAINAGMKFLNIEKSLVYARVGNGMVSRRGNKKYIKSWKILNTYMLENKMIKKIEYIRNMISVTLFVYTPGFMKKIIYSSLLRN